MATKHFCDGCDKEQQLNDLNQVTVEWQRNTAGLEDRKFDLCRYCLTQFKSKFPDKWERVRIALPDIPPLEN